MKFFDILSVGLLISTAAARSAQHVGKKLPELQSKKAHLPQKRSGDFPRRQASPYMTDATAGK